MEVLHVTKTTGVGGSERHLLDLIPAQRASGIRARLVLLQERARPAPQMTAAFRARGVPTAVVRIRADVDPLALGALVRMMGAERPDIVHTHLVHADTHATAAARLAGVRAVIGTRHSLLTESARRRFPIRDGIIAAARLADHVIAISDAVAEAAQTVERLQPEKLTRVYYGIPMPRAQSEAPPLVVGAAGRLIPGKGLETLLAAWSRMRVPKARLLIAGSGPLLSSLQALAADLGVGESVTFVGHQQDITTWMRGLWAFVQPSEAEGLGLGAVEAAGVGLPVVASAVGGLREVVVPGRTGLLVPPRDANALTRALTEVLTSAETARRMGAAGRRHVEERFSLPVMVAATTAVYDAVLGARSPHLVR